MKNLFALPGVAALYDIGRPYFHPLVIERFRRFSGVGRVAAAADIACGTGHSTRAVAAIAGEVDAVDSAAEMVAAAPALPGVRYAVAAAEQLPFPDRAFDLATIGVAHHWLDRGAFLGEAARILRPGGWLVVYSGGHAPTADGHPALARWAVDDYPARFPPPPRDAHPLTAAEVDGVGLSVAGEDFFEHAVPVTRQQVVGFFATQSNVLAACAAGRCELADAVEWIGREVEPFFTGPTVPLGLTVKCWYLRRRGAGGLAGGPCGPDGSDSHQEAR